MLAGGTRREISCASQARSAAAAQVYVRENFLGDVHLLRYAGLIGEA